MAVTRKPRTRKTPAVKKPDAEVRTIITDGNKVNITESSHDSDVVTVLFCSRLGQRFRLPNGHEVFLAGNAIDLAGKKDGALPYGGYRVNIVNAADWAEVKRLYGKAYKPWFDGGKIIESQSEREAVGIATDNANDDPDDNPVDMRDMRTTTAPVEG